MYHFSRTDPLSTVEPETPPLQSRIPTVPPNSRDYDLLQSRTASDSDRARSTAAQEQDSGYEASPCSIATSSSSSDLQFFGSGRARGTTYLDDLGVQPDDMVSAADDVFEQCPSVLLESEESWRPDCATCPCRATPANSRNCDIVSDDSSSRLRPSSMPIRIPTVDPGHVVPSTNCRCPAGDAVPQSPVLPPAGAPGLLPRSWPLSVLSTWWNRLSPSALLREERIRRVPPRRLIRQIPQTSQGRRRLIDSDAPSSSSDQCSSEEEDCLQQAAMADAEAFPSRLGSRDPLPDLILHSSPSSSRRNRSLSVNLPVADIDMYQRIGRSLRRLSDQFEREMLENERPRTQRRRGTMDCTYRRPS